MIILILNKLELLNRRSKKIIMILVDAIAIISILFLSFSIRMGELYWPKEDIYWTFLFAPIIAIPIFYSFNLYSSVLRYIGSKAILSIAQAVSFYAVL